MKQRGFTIIELFALILLIFVVGLMFWTQKNNIETASRDDKRKTSINAMYYALEEVFYPANKYYPKTLTESTLPSVDPATFKDPHGVKLGQPNSDYSYEGKGCTNDKCTSYTLRARLENEADFVKDSRNK